MLKNDIRQRTRFILGIGQSDYHPYTRPRRTSTTSTCSSNYDFSLPSPSGSSLPSLPQSPISTSSEHDQVIFERLRRMVPKLHGERNAVQLILDAVSQAMEEPQKTTTPTSVPEEVPADLESVDVSAFKHLIRSQPLFLDPRLL